MTNDQFFTIFEYSSYNKPDLKLKAIVLTDYGGPDQLQLIEVEKPSPRDGEVLVKIHAVSINDWDWALIQGDFVNRMINGFSKPKRRILGSRQKRDSVSSRR